MSLIYFIRILFICVQRYEKYLRKTNFSATIFSLYLILAYFISFCSQQVYRYLKNYHGEDAIYPVSLEDSWYTCAFGNEPGILSLDHTRSANSVSLGVDAEDYNHVKVEGYGDNLTALPTLSCPIIACVDKDNNVLGGIICIPNSDYDEAYVNAGWTIVRSALYPSTFEMDIPDGTSKIYTSMSIPSQTNFKMTLYKIDIA